jgi:hypothetical protein
MRIVLSLVLLYLNSIDANQTELWESAFNELREAFGYKLELNVNIHYIYDKKIDDLKNLSSGKAPFDSYSKNFNIFNKTIFKLSFSFKLLILK